MARNSIDETGYSTEGEIVAAGGWPAQHLVVELDRFDPIKLRPGRRVVILTEDEFRQLTQEAAYCPSCDQ